MDFKILNFFIFFRFNPFVSLAKTAKPSNAVLLDNGFFEGDRIFFEETPSCIKFFADFSVGAK